MSWQLQAPRATSAVLILLSAACSHAQGPATRAAIDSSVARVVRGANAVDPAATFALASSDFTMVNGTEIYPTRDSTVAVFVGVFKGLRSQDIRIERSDVKILSPLLALSTATGTFTTTDTAKVVSPPRHFVWTIVWRFENGAWRMVAVHQSITGAQ